MTQKQLSTSQSWDKWPDETDLAYSYFVSYMEMGPERSLSKVVQKHNKKAHYKTQLGKWSAKHNWVERASEYDKHVIKQSLRDKEEIIDHARGRLLQKVDQALDELFDIMAKEDYSFSKDHASNVSQKLKAIDMILSKAGLVKPAEPPELHQSLTVNEYYDKIYQKIERITAEEKLE